MIHIPYTRRGFLGLLAAGTASLPLRAEAVPPLVAAARRQVGVTLIYDARYVRLDYPNGDIERRRGVCTDVVIRAYRDAFGADLQKLVHEDMRASFSAYPKNWGLTRPDRNIDHRRVPNLATFFRRKGAQLAVPENGADWEAGDIVAYTLPSGVPHIAIVSDTVGRSGNPRIIHNIGWGAREDDELLDYTVTGRYRFTPA